MDIDTLFCVILAFILLLHSLRHGLLRLLLINLILRFQKFYDILRTNLPATESCLGASFVKLFHLFSHLLCIFSYFLCIFFILVDPSSFVGRLSHYTYDLRVFNVSPSWQNRGIPATHSRWICSFSRFVFHWCCLTPTTGGWVHK